MALQKTSIILLMIGFGFLLSCDKKESKEEGLIGYWAFDSIENGIVKDLSGNGLDGKVISFELTDGKFGKAMDSKNGYLEIPWSAISDSLQNGLTISTWVNRDTSTSWNCIITREVGTGPSEYYDLGVFKDLPLFSIDPGGKDHFTKVERPEPLPIHQWVNLVGVYDNKTLKFYINGKLVSETALALPIKSEDKNPIIIGSNSNDGGKVWHGYFYGKIDEVKFYNRPLSAGEVGLLFSKQ
jgi:Concanavalin A-like lectin/glucanases superfamily